MHLAAKYGNHCTSKSILISAGLALIWQQAVEWRRDAPDDQWHRQNQFPTLFEIGGTTKWKVNEESIQDWWHAEMGQVANESVAAERVAGGKNRT